MTHTTSTPATPATFSHRTMTRREFRTRIAERFGRRGERGLTLKGPYMLVEYLSAPAGLLVLAHRRYADQVDGIHPVALSRSVQSWNNIIEPFAVDYAAHYVTHRSHGGLVLEGFGRQIEPGAPEVTEFGGEDGFLSLELFNTPNGPIVAVIEDAETVHLIERETVACDMREAA